MPTPLGVGAVLLAILIAGFNAFRAAHPIAALAALLALAGGAAFVVDVLVVDRDAVHTTRRVVAPRNATQHLRLVDLNVLHGYPDFRQQEARAERTIEALASLEPDVVVLQEAWRTRVHGDFVARLGEALGFDTAYARANGKLARIGFEEGEAILSRFPILSAERIVLKPRRPFFERRVALICVLDLGDRTQTVIGMHLDNRDLKTATAQAEHLALQLPSAEAPMLAGDLNAKSKSSALAVFLDLGFTDLVPGGIDHVLAQPSSWRPASARWVLTPIEDELHGEVGLEFSDHPGILVDFERELLPVADVR